MVGIAGIAGIEGIDGIEDIAGIDGMCGIAGIEGIEGMLILGRSGTDFWTDSKISVVLRFRVLNNSMVTGSRSKNDVTKVGSWVRLFAWGGGATVYVKKVGCQVVSLGAHCTSTRTSSKQWVHTYLPRYLGPYPYIGTQVHHLGKWQVRILVVIYLCLLCV